MLLCLHVKLANVCHIKLLVCLWDVSHCAATVWLKKKQPVEDLTHKSD